jgi:phage terminase Nu1 subunit (DNA packaging protein)
MSEYQIQIGNEVRDMTEEEIVQRNKDLADSKKLAKAQADRAKLKTATLAKLGLTEDEVAALLS